MFKKCVNKQAKKSFIWIYYYITFGLSSFHCQGSQEPPCLFGSAASGSRAGFRGGTAPSSYSANFLSSSSTISGFSYTQISRLYKNLS